MDAPDRSEPGRGSTVIDPTSTPVIGFGFRRFANHRIRTLRYAGKPNRGLPTTITPG
jgi:hypothetical protein